MELALAFVDTVNELAVVDGKLGGVLLRLVDDLDGLVAETIERLSPEAGRAAVAHHWQDDGPDELLGALEQMRRRAAARTLRDLLQGAVDG